jgi:hypothetical protein
MTAGKNNNGNGNKRAECNSLHDDDDLVGEDSVEFLVGKVVTLYNNLDNKYHVGCIVD